MADINDELTRAFREIAASDVDDARRMSMTIEPRLMAEFRAVRTAGTQRTVSRSIELALAASLAAAIAIPVWLVRRGTLPSSVNTAGRRGEITTAFMPLPYSGVPMTEGHVVRLEVPRSALVAFGLAPVDMPDVRKEAVLADVIVGEDGLARAVRFVRAVRAPGVTP